MTRLGQTIIACSVIVGGVIVGLLVHKTKRSNEPMPLAAISTQAATAPQVLHAGEQIQTCNGGYCTCEGDCAWWNVHHDASGNLIAPPIDTVINLGTTSIFSFTAQHYLTWSPKPDITAYELAQAIPIIYSNPIAIYDKLPPEVQRHFDVH